MDLVSKLILLFSSIGIFDALYIITIAFSGAKIKCWFFPQKWCEKVVKSKYSKTFGISNGLLGLMLYQAIFMFTLLSIYTAVPFEPAMILITAGFLFSMYFLYIQAFVLRAFCTYCVLSAFNFAVMFGAVIAKVFF